MPSRSVSAWSGLTTSGQLSTASRTPSLSSSGSQTSPRPSASESVWSGLNTRGQLSSASRTPSLSSSGSQTSPRPSASEFVWSGLKTRGQLSSVSRTPSLSSSGAQASPRPSVSESVWSGLKTSGQLSTSSGTPSPSVSSAQADELAWRQIRSEGMNNQLESLEVDIPPPRFLETGAPSWDSRQGFQTLCGYKSYRRFDPEQGGRLDPRAAYS